MNWKTLIQNLLDAGLTQSQIALTCKTGQSHISGLYRGERKCPNHDLGEAIIKLHREYCADQQEAA